MDLVASHGTIKTLMPLTLFTTTKANGILPGKEKTLLSKLTGSRLPNLMVNRLTMTKPEHTISKTAS